MTDRQKLEAGIAAYAHEQRMFVRLLRKRGSFTEDEFDDWFRGREWRRPILRRQPLTGDTFLLGHGLRSQMVGLLQVMARLGIVLIDAGTVSLPRQKV